MALSDEELDRYARHIVLPQIGGAGQLKLKSARIAVVGAGGIGAGAIPALTGAGVGHLTIIDDDRVELSNLQRQPLYAENQIGERKVDLAARYVGKRNRHVECRTIPDRIDIDNVDAILSGHDLIIDGTDNFATRLAVSDAAVRLGTPLISAAAQQFQGQVALFRGRPCYRCFVGDAFDVDDCDTCAELGVLGAVTGTVGNFAALLVIRAIVNIGEDASGKLFLLDGAALTWKSIRLPRDPGCRACGEDRAADS